jgi:hypothetical protein
MLLVRVQPEELSVRLGSYPGGGEGDQPVEASGKEVMKMAASVRAATRVKPEQAPKVESGTSSPPFVGEDRWSGLEQPTSEGPFDPRGIGRSTHAHIDTQHGRPDAGSRRQESEEPIVPMKPGNAGGGKGLWFEVRLDESRIRRSA